MNFPLLLMTNLPTSRDAILSSISLLPDLHFCFTWNLLSGHWTTSTLSNKCFMISIVPLLLRSIQMCFLRITLWKPPSNFPCLKFRRNPCKIQLRRSGEILVGRPNTSIPVSLPTYRVSWFREPFLLLAAMFCRLDGLSIYSSFKIKCVLMANHILLTGDSFN